jgi:3'(2'), 5'-bisphosphate nucleotidase
LTKQLPHLFNVALSAVMEASAEIMKIYNENQIDINYKSNESPVTQTDIKSSGIITKHLETTNIPVICEETTIADYSIRKNWEYFWLVDPLDGTKEFISRNGEFTVNVALIHKNTPILGLITIPAIGLLYWGDSINGAYKINMPEISQFDYNSLIRKAVKLPVNEDSQLIRILVSRQHLDEKTKQKIRQIERKYKNVSCISTGSSLKFCYIAEGKADLYFRYSPTMEWDTAAGHAIIKASGASMVKLPSKKPFLYNKRNLLNSGFCVSTKSFVNSAF